MEKGRGYEVFLPSLYAYAQKVMLRKPQFDYGKLSPKEQTVILKEQSNWEKALRVFEWMKSQEDYVPNFLLTELFRTGGRNPSRVSEIENTAYAAIIDAYADKGSRSQDVFFGRRDKFIQKKAIVEYNVMIKAYGIAKLYDKAFSLFKGMKSQGTWPDECTYNSLIQMFSGGDLVDQAKELLAEMQGLRFKPSCSTFSALIASLCAWGRAYIKLISRGAKLYEQMKKLHGGPDVIASNSMLNLYADLNGLEAKLIFDHLREKGQADGVTFATLIYAYKNMGMLDEAIEIAEEMKQSGLLRDCVTFNKMGAHLRFYLLTLKRRVLLGRGKVLDCARVVLPRRLQVKWLKGIKRIYGQLKYGLIEPNESLYNAIIDGYSAAGRYDLADLVSQEMKLDLDVKQLTDSESEGVVDEVLRW
ncbi:hypothetical protein HAX54_017575 [Datura stramonium]|uniref:Pentatricopeptide repeat-containing protein n=1 Tax=Datura stramonium TaxID=4076 RepID=A0ABS8S0W5_DATST|nr:hypothetical protein [Datura stramonium]